MRRSTKTRSRALSLAFMVTLLLCACGGDHRHEDPAGSMTVPGLSTNAGKKWKMDDHTRSMFTVMTRRLAEHSGDPEELGKSLSDDLDRLVRGCTMTGSVHDELHRFLIFYVPAITTLSESGSAEALQKVTRLLKAYPEYFE